MEVENRNTKAWHAYAVLRSNRLSQHKSDKPPCVWAMKKDKAIYLLKPDCAWTRRLCPCPTRARSLAGSTDATTSKLRIQPVKLFAAVKSSQHAEIGEEESYE